MGTEINSHEIIQQVISRIADGEDDGPRSRTMMLERRTEDRQKSRSRSSTPRKSNRERTFSEAERKIIEAGKEVAGMKAQLLGKEAELAAQQQAQQLTWERLQERVHQEGNSLDHQRQQVAQASREVSAGRTEVEAAASEVAARQNELTSASIQIAAEQSRVALAANRAAAEQATAVQQQSQAFSSAAQLASDHQSKVAELTAREAKVAVAEKNARQLEHTTKEMHEQLAKWKGEMEKRFDEREHQSMAQKQHLQALLAQTRREQQIFEDKKVAEEVARLPPRSPETVQRPERTDFFIGDGQSERPSARSQRLASMSSHRCSKCFEI